LREFKLLRPAQLAECRQAEAEAEQAPYQSTTASFSVLPHTDRRLLIRDSHLPRAPPHLTSINKAPVVPINWRHRVPRARIIPRDAKP